MTKVSKLVAAMGIAFATIGTASADKFDGFYVGGGVTFNQMTVKYGYSYHENYYGSLYSEEEQSTYGDNEHSADFDLNVGYAMSFGNFNLAAELGYTSGYGEAELWSGYGDSESYELTRGKTFSILPGYKLGQDTLVYGRFGIVKAEGEYSNSWDSGDTYSLDFSGKIWGIGVKHAFTPNLVAVLEYQVTEFDSETLASGGYAWSANDYNSWHDDVEPASSGVTLGVQYTF